MPKQAEAFTTDVLTDGRSFGSFAASYHRHHKVFTMDAAGQDNARDMEDNQGEGDVCQHLMNLADQRQGAPLT
jgi:hypothetical protein